MTPAALIRSLRARLDLTQAQLAERLSVSLRTLQHWEREDGHDCGTATIREMAEIAGVTIEVDAKGWRVVG